MNLASPYWQELTLADLLLRCLELTAASEDALYSSNSVAEIADVLARSLAAIEKGGVPNRSELSLLFAPTGALQETAMANGWASEYLKLAAIFDDRIK